MAFAGTDNFYVYVDDDPADFADPVGLQKKKKKCGPKAKPCQASLPADTRRRTMVSTLMGEMSGENLVGTHQYADDESGPISDIGEPGGSEITNSTLDLEAEVMAETMLNLGHIGNAGTYRGLPHGRGLTNQALHSAQGTALCTMLLRALSALDFALNDNARIGTSHWRAVVQGSGHHRIVRELNSLGAGTRIGGTDFW